MLKVHSASIKTRLKKITLSCVFANRSFKVVRNKKMDKFLLPNMIELFETNRMSHLPPFYDDFFLQKFKLKDWIFHSAVNCGPELCKGEGTIKTRLASNIDGYPLRLALLFE